jgi:hypothetical protein
VKGVKIKGNIALVIEGTTPPTHNTCRWNEWIDTLKYRFSDKYYRSKGVKHLIMVDGKNVMHATKPKSYSLCF